MASPLLPPNPCLVAILLVVNYHHQPRLVFHYPPRPGEDNAHITDYLKRDLNDSDNTSLSDDDSASASDGHSTTKGKDGGKNKRDGILEVDVEEADSASPEKSGGLALMQRQSKWDDVLGYGAINLAKLLCPASSAHKKRFEMSLNDKAFLGWPVFAKDGNWQRKKRPKRPVSGDLGSEDKAQSGQEQSNAVKRKSNLQIDEELGESTGHETDNELQRPVRDTKSDKREVDPPTEWVRDDTFKQNKGKEEYSKETLKMFHVVFVLDPPPPEYHLRLNEMYGNVVKKLSRGLKWEQAHSNYVSKEVSVISVASKPYNKRMGEK